MRIRSSDSELAEKLAAVVPDEGPGLVYVAERGFVGWDDAENELAEMFAAAVPEATADGPVIYIVGTDALLGRASPLDSAVASGLLAGARAIAFERNRFDGYASLIAVGAEVGAREVAAAVETLLTTRASNGQPFVLGDDHLGAALP